MQREETAKGRKPITLLIAVVIILLIATLVLLYRNRDTNKMNTRIADLHSYCVGQTFSNGSSGHCVTDIQTIANYMEHSGLTQCPFVGGAQLTVNGTYDLNTVAQVHAVQEWASCYAKQEGFTSNVPQDGTVGKNTWSELCTYGYTDPLRSAATKAGATIAAGKDAGCEQL